MKTNGLKRVLLDSVFTFIFSVTSYQGIRSHSGSRESCSWYQKRFWIVHNLGACNNPDISGIINDRAHKKSSVVLTKNVCIRCDMKESWVFSDTKGISNRLVGKQIGSQLGPRLFPSLYVPRNPDHQKRISPDRNTILYNSLSTLRAGNAGFTSRQG